MPTTTTPMPAAAQITALQQVREYPAISVLLTTSPAAQLTRADALRLDALVAQAADRLRTESEPGAAARAVRRLQQLVEQARRGPAANALALYASAGTDAFIRLPVAYAIAPSSTPPSPPATWYAPCTAPRGTSSWPSTPATPGCSTPPAKL